MRRKVEIIAVRATLALLLLLAFSICTRAQQAEPSADQLISRSFHIHIAAVRHALSNVTFPTDAQKPKALREDSATRLADQLRAVFAVAGVQLEDVSATASRPNQKVMFLNDRTGLLIVRVTATELGKIENVLASLPSAPEIAIETKFIETPYTEPSPGDLILQQQQHPNGDLTLTLLTEKQAKEILSQYEAAAGVDVLTPPHVTTISGRQARISMEPTTKTPLYQDPPALPKDTTPDADPTPHNKGRLPFPPTFAPERLGGAI